MGSAIEKEEIKRHLETYRKVGIGGVHIIPIYGAKGYEERYIRYLTLEWMEMFRFTMAEAKRLDMGVDMTSGTGWPFGGEWVRAEDAAVMALSETYSLSGGERFDRKIRSSNEKEAKDARLKALIAFSEAGDTLDLSSKVDSEGTLDWAAPPGNWKLYALFQGRTGQQVKRAAPGGEGNVIDYFSRTSLDNYLARFNRALADFPREFMVRSFYHDSYEVYQADWTDNLFEEFSSRKRL